VLFGPLVKPFGFVPQPPIHLNHEESGLYLAVNNPFVHSTMLARRDALKTLSGYAELIAEDYELWIRAWTTGFRFSRMATYGILYRVHPSQVSQAPKFNEVALEEEQLKISIAELKNQLVMQKLIEESPRLKESVFTSLTDRSIIQRILLSSSVRWLIDFGKGATLGARKKP
jgi:hypothetical protein